MTSSPSFSTHFQARQRCSLRLHRPPFGLASTYPNHPLFSSFGPKTLLLVKGAHFPSHCSLSVSWVYPFFALSFLALVVGLVYGPLVKTQFPCFLKFNPLLFHPVPHVLGPSRPHVAYLKAHIGHSKSILNMGLAVGSY